MNLFRLTIVCAATMLASSAFASPVSHPARQREASPPAWQQILAHEAGEPEDVSGVPLTVDMPLTLARGQAEDDDVSGEGAGHPAHPAQPRGIA